MKNNSTKWFNIHDILSRDKFLNFIVSHRGGGKTFSAKKFAINKFIKTKQQFVYLRRYKTEFGEINKFFDDIKELFPDIEFKVKGTKFFINDEEAGYALALSQQVQIRSTPFPNVSTIIFDEFILDDRGTNLKYLNNEVKTFLEVISTIVRSRNNARVICLANSISYVNPYFEYFNIRINSFEEKCWYYPNNKKDGECIVQVYQNKVFTEEMEQTKFGKLIKGTSYGEYAINNKVLLDSNSFIMKKQPKDSVFQFYLVYDGKEIGCWYSEEYSSYIFNNKYISNTRNVFTITNNDAMYNVQTIKSMKNKGMFKVLLKKAFQSSRVYYGNNTVKKDMLNIFKILGYY